VRYALDDRVGDVVDLIGGAGRTERVGVGARARLRATALRARDRQAAAIQRRTVRLAGADEPPRSDLAQYGVRGVNPTGSKGQRRVGGRYLSRPPPAPLLF
jgi:hypothetical protein